MKFITRTALLLFVLVFWGEADGSAAAYNNDKALAGVSQTRVYFDVNLGEAAALAWRMDLIDRTLGQLRDAGIGVEAVIGFRGEASPYVTTGDHYVLDEEIEDKRKIQEWIKKFTRDGVTIEQCGIAAEHLGIALTDFMPEVTIVQSGYVSLIGYQSKGFAIVGMD